MTDAEAETLGLTEVVAVTPTLVRGVWRVSPGKKRLVGVARIGGVELWIRPKLPVARLLFLLGYAYDVTAWRRGTVELAEDTELLPLLATAYVRAAERAVEQGLIQGYRVTEEATPVLRGRVRTDDQLRRRFGLAVPLEVRFDDYTVDITENRILRTAAERLLRLPGVHRTTRGALLRLVRLLADVTSLDRGARAPVWQPSRLNARYTPALRLGELVLAGGSIEQREGSTAVDGFLVEMPRLFEQFLTVALREAPACRGGRVTGQRTFHLDAEGSIPIRPDILWHGRPHGPVTGVADAKYKAEKPSGYPNADVYQMLAYCTRLGLKEGHLVYAKGEREPGRHRIVGSPVTVVRHALDLDVPPEAVLAQVNSIAEALTHHAPSRQVDGGPRLRGPVVDEASLAARTGAATAIPYGSHS